MKDEVYTKDMIDILERVKKEDWLEVMEALVRTTYLKGMIDGRDKKAEKRHWCENCTSFDSDEHWCDYWKGTTIADGLCHNWKDEN